MRAVTVTGPHESDWHETDVEGLERYQAIVGGYIEALPIPHDKATVFMNEEGAIHGLPVFTLWTDEDGIMQAPLRGPLVILGPVTADTGETLPLTDEALAYVKKVVRPIQRQDETRIIVSDGSPCPHCNGSGYRDDSR